MGQLTNIILGSGGKLTRYSPSAPTYIGTGDTADKVLLNPAIAGETTAQGLLELLEARPGGSGLPDDPIDGGTFF